jgi:hypothetical protein
MVEKYYEVRLRNRMAKSVLDDFHRDYLSAVERDDWNKGFWYHHSSGADVFIAGHGKRIGLLIDEHYFPEGVTPDEVAKDVMKLLKEYDVKRRRSSRPRLKK